MREKARRFDFNPDEFIAGISGKLDLAEIGLYWLISAFIYSKGGPIDDDSKWLSRICRDTDPRTIRAVLERLIKLGKVIRLDPSQTHLRPISTPISDPSLTILRCQEEIELAERRIRHARKIGPRGGRPSSEINDVVNDAGLTCENPPAMHSSPPPSPATPQSVESPDGDSPHVPPKPKRSAGRDGFRLPADWQATQELRKYASERNVDPDLAQEDFKNYWRDIPGNKGKKLDWDGTFRNRVMALQGWNKFPIAQTLNGGSNHGPGSSNQSHPGNGIGRARPNGDERGIGSWIAAAREIIAEDQEAEPLHRPRIGD